MYDSFFYTKCKIVICDCNYFIDSSVCMTLFPYCFCNKKHQQKTSQEKKKPDKNHLYCSASRARARARVSRRGGSYKRAGAEARVQFESVCLYVCVCICVISGADPRCSSLTDARVLEHQQHQVQSR